MTDKRRSNTTDFAAISDIVAGVALGLFIGALVGLSLTSGTTSTVVTALVAVLAIFFGLTETAGTTKIRPATGRIAAFCIAALAATIVGTYVRTYNLLSPSGSYLSEVSGELRTLGYSDDQIREMIKVKYFGSSDQQKPLPGESVHRQTGTEAHFPSPAKQ